MVEKKKQYKKNMENIYKNFIKVLDLNTIQRYNIFIDKIKFKKSLVEYLEHNLS